MRTGLKFGMIAVALAAALAGCGKSDDAIPDAGSGQNAQITVKPNDIIRGNPNAKVTLLEYASMTCPHCSRWDKEVLPKIIETYVNTGKVRYIFREYPLDGAARMAAALARCQSGDGFYSFIDLLFRNQDQWIKDSNGDGQISKEDIDANLVQIARVAGMSEEQARTCMNDPKNLAIVDENTQQAQALYNVSGTPTFILGGKIRSAEWMWEDIDKAIKEELAKH